MHSHCKLWAAAYTSNSKVTNQNLTTLGVCSNTWLKAMQLAPKLDTCLYTAWAILQPWLFQVSLGTDWPVKYPNLTWRLGPTLLVCVKPQMLLTTYRPASVPALDHAKPLQIMGSSLHLKFNSHKPKFNYSGCLQQHLAKSHAVGTQT